ncbi:sulfatase-like hydrolase/transferase [Kiritimatiellaeota bacterium B1221]|nr:sulfatase-like hydrolase/transferase [Kiritimatiellaeota bacterium B1221]
MTAPNILLITGDHMRSDLIEATDDGLRSAPLYPHVPTPHLDRLAAGGVSFSHCHALNPICVPSRASITSGCYPHKCTGTKENRGRLKPEMPRLAQHFADRGYQTTAIGKLHYLPYMPPGEPRTLHGFQYAELCEEGRILNSFDPDGQQRGLEEYRDFLSDHGWGGYERSHGIGNNDIHPGTVPFSAELHEEAWVATRSIAAIDRHQEQHPDQPFFMWSSFTKPHPPYDPPAPYDRLIDPRSLPAPLGADQPGLMDDRDPEVRIRDKRFGWDRYSPEMIQTARARYGGLVNFQDEMIGRILTHLEEKGLLENTIVVYTADHGDLLGDFGRFFKSSLFDGSVKVPLIIHAPQSDAETGKRNQLVGLHDLFPTLCALSGQPVPDGMDGQNLTPVLKDPTSAGREFFVSQCFDSPLQKYMIRTEKWKYIYHESGSTEELYKLEGKDYELNNLASQHPEITASFQEKLKAWCRENGDEMIFDDAGELRSHPGDCPQLKAEFTIGELGWRKY